jgi:hypothetical protein
MLYRGFAFASADFGDILGAMADCITIGAFIALIL